MLSLVENKLVQDYLGAKFQWDSFTVGTEANPVTSQTLTCKVKLCGDDCIDLARDTVCPYNDDGLDFNKVKGFKISSLILWLEKPEF